MSREVFETLDYVVVAAMLAVSGVIGIYFRFSGGKQRTTSEYLMAGRDMSLFPVVISLMATAQTAIGTLGYPGEVYLYGANVFMYPVGFFLALVTCTFVYTPVYFKIQVTSAYEYLERRFGKVTRTVISGLFIIQMVLFMSVGLYSPSIALSAVSGLSNLVSILSVGCVCAFYCTLGGMKAVLWTDVFQSTLMYSALFAVVVKGCLDLGGFQNVIDIAREGQRLQFFNYSLDPTIRFTFWSSIVGGFMYGITTSAANQTQVQRLLTVSTLRRSKMALLSSIPFNLVIYYTTLMCGVVIYSNFAGCDPLLRPEISKISTSDQLIPYYMITSFSSLPGMAGFCVSGVFCAALTSVSSAVNSLAAVTIEDFVKPFCNTRNWLSDAKEARLSKVFAFSYSGICIGMTYLLGNVKSIIPASFVVFTAIGGPTLSVITLGMITTTANEKGALAGLLSGIILNTSIGFGNIMSNIYQAKLPLSIANCTDQVFPDLLNSTDKMLFTYTPEFETTATAATSTVEQGISVLNDDVFPLFKITFLLQPIPGTILTFLIGYIVSFITGGKNGDVDTDLLSPIVKRWLKKSPESCEKQVSKFSGDTSANGALKYAMANGTARNCTHECESCDEVEESHL